MTNGHLDLEHLSAVVDGEEGAGGDHLAACDDCRRRLARLDAAARAVAAPVAPLDAARRDAVVQAALAAWEQELASPAAAARHQPAAAQRAPRAHRAGRRWDRAVRAPWLAVAAVLLLLALAVPLAVRLGDRGGLDGEQAAGGAASEDRAETEAAAGALDDEPDAAVDDEAAGDAGDAASAVAEVVDGGDVGELGDPPALADLGPAVRDDLTGGGATSTAAGPCGEVARDAAPGAGELRWVADARVAGTPAVVHAVALGDANERLLLVATAVDGCRVLATAAA